MYLDADNTTGFDCFARLVSLSISQYNFLGPVNSWMTGLGRKRVGGEEGGRPLTMNGVSNDKIPVNSGGLRIRPRSECIWRRLDRFCKPWRCDQAEPKWRSLNHTKPVTCEDHWGFLPNMVIRSKIKTCPHGYKYSFISALLQFPHHTTDHSLLHSSINSFRRSHPKRLTLTRDISSIAHFNNVCT